jgi:enoyl-CoA hydratase/carnithine racemase
MKSTTNNTQLRLARLTPAYWRVTFDNPPLNLMGPEFVLQFREIVTAIETDEQLKVVVFDSAVEGFFLNHSDFLAKLECRATIRMAARQSGWQVFDGLIFEAFGSDLTR